MAKPKIDLSDPRIRAAVDLYTSQATIAATAAARKDDAVRPVYALNVRTNKIAQEGSCVLLAVADQIFALSASHVFDAVGQYQLLIGCGNRLHALPGDRFSSARGPSGTHRDDPVDASVFHICAEVGSEVRTCALSIADLDFMPAPSNSEFYVASGYRISKSRSTATTHTTELERFPTLALDNDHYRHWQITRETHLLLAFDDQVVMDMKWQTAPSIRGFSGGAMFRVEGLDAVTRPEGTVQPRAKLAAILTERRKGTRGSFFSGAVGARLGAHLGLIDQYLPNLYLKEQVEAEVLRRPDPSR
jgi:hypothetical protein